MTNRTTRYFLISKYYLFLSVLLILHNNTNCQSAIQHIKFTNISIKNGLSQTSPNCILQDSHGIVWIGTEDGLNKYDGYSFIVYKPMPGDPHSISNSRILSIKEDNRRCLWVGTNGGGLNRFDRNENKFYPVANDTLLSAGKIITCILAYNDSTLCVGTEKGPILLNTISGKYIEIASVYPELASIAGIPVNTMISDSHTIWIGTPKGLFRFNIFKKTFDQYTNNPEDNKSLPNNMVTALLIDRFQNILVGSESDLSVLDQKTGNFIRVVLDERNSNSSVIRALLEDNDGEIWVATYGNGLFIGSIQTGHFENYIYDHLNPYSIKNNEVLSLFKDYSGLIWVGTNGIDIYCPRKEKFVLYDYVPYSREQLIFRNIHPIYQDSEDVLWIGSKTDGLHILDRTKKTYSRWTHNPGIKDGLSSNRIRAIKEYPKGVLWVGTEDAGLDKIYLDGNRKPVRFRNYKHKADDINSLTSNKIYALYPDDQGNMWIGTDNGLTIMNIESETFKQYVPDNNNPSAISNTTVYAIFGDNKKNIWLATDLGVNKYDPASGGFKHYIHEDGNKNSLIHNEILCFHQDQSGNLWIGTYGKGFDKYDPDNNKFTHFSDISEVSTAVIYGILEDTHGNFWMSTNNGILKFNEKTREIKQFDIEDGLQSNEFNGTSYLINNQGEMFFGGQFGFNSFYPDDVQVDMVAPKIILSDLQVQNVSVVPGKHSPITRHINEAKEIILNYKQNNFTLYFSALHFANPSQNQYKYKLEGFDKDWIEAGNKRFVSYTNLPYRSYKFVVIAANSDGIWNTDGISIKIKVKPPLWGTIWFRIIMFLIIAGGIVLIIRRRITRDQRQKKIIEEKFKASSKELEKARLQMEEQHTEIIVQKRELVVRQKDQENLLWFNQGLGQFSDLISKNRENLKQLCKEFIENLVDYVEAQQGGIFLFNDDDETDKHLELVASYAFSASRSEQRFIEGEGYVGACFKDKKFVEIDNLSENYSVLNSGLGSLHIKHLVLAPLVVNNDCIGVVELGSFKKIKGYRVTFIEKLVETVASTILTEQANNRLKKLIERSTLQAEELSENEEQMRMNLEEIMAAQEESSRREDELIKLAEESATREEMLNQEIEMLKNQINQMTGQPSSN